MNLAVASDIGSIMQECNEALDREWCDPKAATEYLLRIFDAHLRTRTESLENKGYLVQDQIEWIVNIFIQRGDQASKEPSKKSSEATFRAKKITGELEVLQKDLKKAAASPKDCRKILQLIGLRIEELRLCELDLEKVSKEETKTSEEAEKLLERLKEIWLPIKNVHWLIFKFHRTGLAANLAAKGLRTTFYSIAFMVTFLSDRYAQSVDPFIRYFQEDYYHTIAVLLIFVLQLLLLDRYIASLVKRMYRKLLRWIIASFTKAIADLQLVDQKLSDAAKILGSLK